MIFDLVKDFAEALKAMPEGHPRRRIVKLLDEAIRRDVHFIDRHPTTLFQCMWNTCWWYDCPEAAKHYEEPEGGWKEPPPWEWQGEKLSGLLEDWRRHRVLRQPWLRSLRPPPLQLGSAQVTVLRGHELPVKSLAVSADGTQIVSASSESLCIWDRDSGALRTRLTGNADGITSVAVSQDRRWIACGSWDCTVRIWDLACFSLSQELTGLAESVNSVDFSPDSRQVVLGLGRETGASFNSLQVWDLATGTQSLQCNSHQGRVNCARFSPDGRWIASGDAEIRGKHFVRVWDAENGEERARLAGHMMPVESVAFSPDGTRIVSGSRDATIRVWDVDTATSLAELFGHDFYVTSVAFSPDGRYIASGSFDRSVRIWDAETYTQVRHFRGHLAPVDAVVYLGSGHRVLSAGTDCTLRIWDTTADEPVLPPVRHLRYVTSLAWSPDGSRLVSGEKRECARIWDASSGECLKLLQKTTDADKIAPWLGSQLKRVIRWVWRSFVDKIGLPTHTIHAFQLSSGTAETSVFTSNAGKRGRRIAAFSDSLKNVRCHPSGKKWAGTFGNDVAIVELSGDIPASGGPHDLRPRQ